jgi:glutamyl-tRNA synthetase
MSGRRVRFAPSPTGALHIGSLRTALFNYLAARSTGGTFILRIEDTDQGRYVPGSEAQILASLRWLGLQWDEGPEVGGPYAPYVQSLRTERYRAAAEQLLASHDAYWCTCTPERLEAMRAAQRAAREPTRYDRRCLHRQEEVAAERAAGVPAVVRQRIPDGSVTWNDLIRGPVDYAYEVIDDSVLLKSDGFPTYHLANVVDDHDMQITHVVRAEEWIPSTPKHLALYAAFGWDPPAFAHVPVVLGPDKLKLSKRRGAPDVLTYRDQGYLPVAVINAMALLGWSSGTTEEVFTLDELVERFAIERVNPAPAIYDEKRLEALNGLHIRRLSDGELVDALQPWLPTLKGDQIAKLVPLLRERLPRLDAAPALVAPLVGEASVPADAAFPPKGVDAQTARVLLEQCAADVDEGGLDDPTALRLRLTALVEERGVKARDAFRVLYLAVLGAPSGLPVFDAMAFIGADHTAARLRAALTRLPPS